MVISAFAATSLCLWLVVSVRSLLNLKRKSRNHREYLRKLIQKRQSLVPLLLVSIEKITQIESALKADILAAREASMKASGLEKEKEFTGKINEVIELAMNHSEIKKSGYFLEIVSEIEKNFEASKEAISVLENDVFEINSKMENKIFLVSGILAGIRDFDRRVM